jgi:hypothetical protein
MDPHWCPLSGVAILPTADVARRAVLTLPFVLMPECMADDAIHTTIGASAVTATATRRRPGADAWRSAASTVLAMVTLRRPRSPRSCRACAFRHSLGCWRVVGGAAYACAVLGLRTARLDVATSVVG